MGVAVAILLIVQPDARRDQLAQEVHHIQRYAFVPIFLNHDGGGCALGVDVEQAILDAAFFDNGTNPLGDVDQSLRLLRFEEN